MTIKPVLKKSIFNPFYRQLWQSELDSRSAWCPGPPPCRASRPELPALPPKPTSSLLPWAQCPWVADAADAAFVSPTSTCHGIARGRCYANPEPSSCSPSAPSSCGHKRGKGSQRRGGRRMEAKAGWIFPGPSQIYSTKKLILSLYREERWNLSRLTFKH